MNRFFFRVLIALTTISTFWACSAEDPWSPYQSKASLSHNSKGWDETSITLKTSGDIRFNWEAVIVEGYEWASFSSSLEQMAIKGKVGNTAIIYFDINDTTVSRSATVYIKFSDGYETALSFTQLGKSENTSYDRAWGEQPAQASEAPNTAYIFEQSGKQKYATDDGDWIAAFPAEDRKEILAMNPDIAAAWHPVYGDRVNKLVFIGRKMDKAGIIKSLDACIENA